MSAGIKSMRVGKVEKPRPLKSASSSSIVGKGVDDVLADLEKVSRMIAGENFTAAIASAITSLSFHLKMMGHQLEGICKDELDKRFVHLRNGCRDERLDRASRVRLLELVELRAQQTPWTCNENVSNYYRQVLQLLESQQCAATGAAPTREVSVTSGQLSATSCSEPPQLPPLLTPGEVIRGSGKYPKPTKIQGKYKDEVVIRNCDSGKVAAGAKERLVQLTGPGEENVLRARELIEEVIRRNASPAREERGSAFSLTAGEGSTGSLNSVHSDENTGPRKNGSGDFGALGEFKYTVFVGEHSIKLTSKNVDVVKTAKLVLDEYFNASLAELEGCMMDDLQETGTFVSAGGDGRACDCPSPSELIRAEASVVSATDREPVVILKPPQPAAAAADTAPAPTPQAVSSSGGGGGGGYSQQDRRNTYSRRLVIPSSADVNTAVAAAAAAAGEPASASASAVKPAPSRQYSRAELLMYARSAVARYPPRGWTDVRERHPAITRATPVVFDPDEAAGCRPTAAAAVINRQGSADSTTSRSPTPP